MAESKTLVEALADWTDWDLAAYRLGQSLGLFKDLDFAVDTKWVFWTNNVLGQTLYDMLIELAAIGILEHRQQPDSQFRARHRVDDWWTAWLMPHV